MTETAPHTVVLVDDDPGVLRALARVLTGEGWPVETYASAEAFLARSGNSDDGCLVLDVTMPGVDGIELQRRLVEAGDCPPIIFLSGHGNVATSVQAMKAGAMDFLTKPVSGRVLVGAVRSAMEEAAWGRQAREEMARLRRRFSRLTHRQFEVLAALARGELNKQIAAELGVTEQTVKFHRAQIMERMQAKTVAELMYMAAQIGVSAAEPVGAPLDDPGEPARRVGPSPTEPAWRGPAHPRT